MRSYVNGGAGDFECIKSVSGRCHYLLFVRDCDASAPAASDQPCAAPTVQAFTLDAGTSRHLANLPPRLQQCASHDSEPPAPACQSAQGSALPACATVGGVRDSGSIPTPPR